MYTSEATFFPEESEETQADIGNMLGIPNQSNGDWGAALYIDLLQHRVIPEAVAQDSVTVAERGGQRTSIVDLVGGRTGDRARREYNAVQAARKMVAVTAQENIKGVNISVTTPWPSVSRELAVILLRAITDFNIESRRSQANAEREFAETQVTQAEQSVRAAENSLQDFLQRNRAVNGPSALASERARLQREVSAQRGFHASWVERLEGARVREVRITPVITVVQSPRLPVVAEPRHAGQTAVFGGVIFGILGVLWVGAAHAMNKVRRSRSYQAREFLKLIDDISRGFLRRTRARQTP
jgi:uncharacterized protein involved in exopolysaccharide biosynthesis